MDKSSARFIGSTTEVSLRLRRGYGSEIDLELGEREPMPGGRLKGESGLVGRSVLTL